METGTGVAGGGSGGFGAASCPRARRGRRAAGCRRSAPGEAARLPPRSPGPARPERRVLRARARAPAGRAGRTCAWTAQGRAAGSRRRTRKSSVPPRHCKYLLPLTVLVTGLCGLLSSYHPRSGPCISSFRRLSLTLELPGKPVEKAGPLVPMYRGEAEAQARILNALLKGHTGLRTRTQTPLAVIYAPFVLHPRHNFPERVG